MAALAKVQGRGQFTIPEAIRKATGARPGHSLLVRATGQDSFAVKVLPQISANDFFSAMALRDDLTTEDLRRAVMQGIERRVLPDDRRGPSEDTSAFHEGAGRR